MKLVITMSRRFGTGASIIATELSKRLDIPVYDKAYIEEQLNDRMYESEAEAIRKLAEHPCIILGRCASDIFKRQDERTEYFSCVPTKKTVFAELWKKKTSTTTVQKRESKQLMKKELSYYYEHTGKTWGDVNDYHMILDTSELGVENCANILMQYFEKLEYI